MAKKISAADIVKSSRNKNIRRIGTKIRTKNGRTFYKPNNSDIYYESRSKNQYAQITGIGLNRIPNDVKKVISSEGYNVYDQSYINQNFKAKGNANNNANTNTNINKTVAPKRKDLVTRNQPAYSSPAQSKQTAFATKATTRQPVAQSKQTAFATKATTRQPVAQSNRPVSTTRQPTRTNVSNRNNTSRRSNVSNNNTNSSNNGSYSVKKGDTLSAIARRNGISLQELLKNNSHIKDPNRIYVGDKINLTSNRNNAKTTTSSPKAKLDDIILNDEEMNQAPGIKFTKDIPEQLDTSDNEVIYKYNKKKIHK